MAEFPFSRRTVITAIEMLEQFTHAELTRYLLKLGPNFPQWVGGEAISMAKRVNNIISLVDQQPDRELEDGKLLRGEFVERAVALLPPTEKAYPWQVLRHPSAKQTAFLHALELDGFMVTGGRLRRALPTDLQLPEAEDEVVRLLKKHQLTTAKGHLDQAFDAHGRGSWAAANAQIRTFIDALLDGMAEKLYTSAASLGSGQPRRAKLAAIGFLSRGLNEWDDNGGGFINGLTRRLHPQGSHPGLSDDEDCTFRLHIVLLTARLLLVRFDTWGTA